MTEVERAKAFFAGRAEHMERLMRFETAGGSRVYELLRFFFSPHAQYFVPFNNESILASELYRPTMKSHGKNLFDFCCRKKASCVFENVAVSPARLVAMKWLIENGFDDAFWNVLEDVTEREGAHRAFKNKQYSDAYKTKKKSLQEQARDAVLPNAPPGVISRHVRAEIAAYVKRAAWKSKQERKRKAKQRPWAPKRPATDNKFVIASSHVISK